MPIISQLNRLDWYLTAAFAPHGVAKYREALIPGPGGFQVDVITGQFLQILCGVCSRIAMKINIYLWPSPGWN